MIGYGGWARAAYVPALARDGRGRIVAAAARSAPTQERIRAELGSVRVYDSFDRLLVLADVDAVFIAVPNPVHEPAMLAAMDAGIPMFYEPPVADRPERMRPVLRRLLGAAQVTHADNELVYVPTLDRLAAIVTAGTVGTPQTAAIRLQAGWGAAPNDHLSLFAHLAPWYVGALDRVLGRHPRRVIVHDGRGTPGRMQAYTLAVLDYDGVWGACQANLASAGPLQVQVEVNGSEGDATAEVFGGALQVRTTSVPAWRTELIPALQPHAGWPGMHECVSGFLDAVQRGAPSRTDARTVARLHLVGLAGEASIDTGGWASVGGVEDLPGPLEGAPAPSPPAHAA